MLSPFGQNILTKCPSWYHQTWVIHLRVHSYTAVISVSTKAEIPWTVLPGAQWSQFPSVPQTVGFRQNEL